MLGWQKRKW